MAEFHSHQHDGFSQASCNLNKRIRLERVKCFSLDGRRLKVADIVILKRFLLVIVFLTIVFML